MFTRVSFQRLLLTRVATTSRDNLRSREHVRVSVARIQQLASITVSCIAGGRTEQTLTVLAINRWLILQVLVLFELVVLDSIGLDHDERVEGDHGRAGYPKRHATRYEPVRGVDYERALAVRLVV